MKNKTLSAYICDNEMRVWRIADYAIEYHMEHNGLKEVEYTEKIINKINADIEDLCTEIAKLRSENEYLKNLLNLTKIKTEFCPNCGARMGV